MNKKGGFKNSIGDVIPQVRSEFTQPRVDFHKSIKNPAIHMSVTKPKSGSSSRYRRGVPVATSVSRPKSRSRSGFTIDGNKLKYIDELIPININNIFEKLEHIYGKSVVHRCKKIVYDYLLDELKIFKKSHNGVILIDDSVKFNGGGVGSDRTKAEI
jgi:hypothetical protein